MASKGRDISGQRIGKSVERSEHGSFENLLPNLLARLNETLGSGYPC